MQSLLNNHYTSKMLGIGSYHFPVWNEFNERKWLLENTAYKEKNIAKEDRS